MDPSGWILSGSAAASRLLAACLLGATAPVGAESASTWYVRADGGSHSQCTGKVDAPYPGRGQRQPCAWQHPFVALPPGRPPRMAGGDILMIGAGSYMMGLGAPETAGCDPANSEACHMPPIPAAVTPDQPTRILGAGYDSGCDDPPVLWGTEGADTLINLAGSSDVELACLDITDRGGCIEAHCHNGHCAGEVAACRRDERPLGHWARSGISASDSARVVLRDLHIHGLANRGIHAGRLRDWTLERVRIRANGWVGWEGNIGADSGNAGVLLFRDVEIADNGCGETSPEGRVFGCWAAGGGGYGDGLAAGAGGGHWIFENSWVTGNTSDGLDLLYLEDGGRLTIRGGRFEGNAGNQIKVSRSAEIADAVIVGNCAALANEPNMLDTDHCRAAGDAIYLGLAGSSRSTLENNSITGQGNCLVTSGQADAGSELVFADNLFIGQPVFGRSPRRTCLHYSHDSGGSISWQGNFVVDVHRHYCPPDSVCHLDPRIRSRELSDFDPIPLPDSPLITRPDPEGPATRIGALEQRGDARLDRRRRPDHEPR